MDNPKAAKHGLRPQINRLSKYAEQCEARAAHIEDGFADWLALAKNLKKAGDVSRGKAGSDVPSLVGTQLTYPEAKTAAPWPRTRKTERRSNMRKSHA